MAGIPSSDISFDKVTLANGWPAEWFNIYVRENLCAVDPVPRHSLATIHPFLWSEAPYDRNEDLAARSVMDRALDFRFNNGLCIPIHYEASAAAVSIAGDRPHVTNDTKRVLHIIGLYSHTRIQSLVRRKPQDKSLSDNEAEVLRWAAIGKTAWETSVIMRMTERNVKFLLTSAQHKLNAANRTAAVVQAIVNGEIKI
jgi:LuxR family quorum sensing-dependent transcriptional regulator